MTHHRRTRADSPRSRWFFLVLSCAALILGIPGAAQAEGTVLPGPYTQLLPPQSLAQALEASWSQEYAEGVLDQLTARTATQPDRLSIWTQAAVLQLALKRSQGALRTVERARHRSWNEEESAQLDFLEAAAQVAVEPLESDALVGEDHLARAGDLSGSADPA